MKKLRMTCDSALLLAQRRLEDERLRAAGLEARIEALAAELTARSEDAPIVGEEKWKSEVDEIDRIDAAGDGNDGKEPTEGKNMGALATRIDRWVNALVKNYTLWIFVGLLLLGALAVKAYHAVFPEMPEPAVYGSLHLPDQGWRPRQREKFYQTSQGNLVVPFSWFMSLERQPRGFPPHLGQVDLFSSPKVQARYGLLPDTSPFNPHQLPVGLVKDRLADRNVQLLGHGQKEWIGMSCAACHTGQLLYKGRAVRVDGGQSMWNFSQWSSDMVANLVLTVTLPDRFDRFAKRVFKIEGRKASKANRHALRVAMKGYLNSPLIKDAANAIFNHTYPVVEGNTRTAALGRGVNGVFGPISGHNIVRNRGPVSFPPLWFTHDFDWVQSVGAIRQPMGRNITEAWGVSVRVEFENPRYASTARLHDMFWMETLLSVMSPPEWPRDIFGKIDERLAERGRFLYEEAVWKQALPPAKEQLPGDPEALIASPNPDRTRKGYCARCHAPAYEPTPDRFQNRYVQLPLYRL
ncbi:MAG TPA: di-heme-cytochrome C peroxidase, partial [Thermoanaerobaculia bacterium]|nr:di-heme-cytochrome C peroxidase [Thermoanaerobaculia bacterium]